MVLPGVTEYMNAILFAVFSMSEMRFRHITRMEEDR